jgi:hypothetical protein
MTTEFYNIYNSLYSSYEVDSEVSKKTKSSYDEYYYIRLVKRAIENFDNHMLRPDAKYFLLVNFHQLIIKPVLRSGLISNFNKGLFSNSFNLERYVEEDIKNIINLSKEKGRDSEVSGHQVMRIIDSEWRNLRTAKFEIWG